MKLLVKKLRIGINGWYKEAIQPQIDINFIIDNKEKLFQLIKADISLCYYDYRFT